MKVIGEELKVKKKVRLHVKRSRSRRKNKSRLNVKKVHAFPDQPFPGQGDSEVFFLCVCGGSLV